jgi:hypothetical protein
MRDAELRENFERFREKIIDEISDIKERLAKLESGFVKGSSADDLNRRFSELVKELGFSYDENSVFDREVKPSSTLGRLQLQLVALIRSMDLEEHYDSSGTLIYIPSGKSRR